MSLEIFEEIYLLVYIILPIRFPLKPVIFSRDSSVICERSETFFSPPQLILFRVASLENGLPDIDGWHCIYAIPWHLQETYISPSRQLPLIRFLRFHIILVIQMDCQLLSTSFSIDICLSRCTFLQHSTFLPLLETSLRSHRSEMAREHVDWRESDIHLFPFPLPHWNLSLYPTVFMSQERFLILPPLPHKFSIVIGCLIRCTLLQHTSSLLEPNLPALPHSLIWICQSRSVVVRSQWDGPRGCTLLS